MASTDRAVLELLWDIINQRTGELGRVDFMPEKPAFNPIPPEEETHLPRSTPEAQGISSRHLAAFVRALGENRSIHMHQLMVVRHGHVIYEGGFAPFPADIWHATYSMCKSFTGMAVGILIGEGRLHLEDRVVDLLGRHWAASRPNLLSVLRFRELTVRHLLTMSSGVAFNEAGAVSGNDWVRNYLESSCKFTPGSRFEYNSMNSFILSAIVTELTGMTMKRFLEEKLFHPMGIRRVFWETSPKGYTKGGWGMFLRQEDAAKLGLLYLHGGVWEGQRLLPEDWVREAVSPQIRTDREDNPEYGYHVWMDVRPGSFDYNGMLGQNVHVYPDIDMVVVANAGNEEIFQEGRMTTLFRQSFGPDYQPSEDPLPPDPQGVEMLRQLRRRMEGSTLPSPVIRRGGWRRGEKKPLSGGMLSQPSQREEFFRRLNGSVWKMKQSGTGIFPLMLQVVHNNYTRGISELGFKTEDGTLRLIFTEGSQRLIVPVGFDRGIRQVFNISGEEYLVSVRGRFAANEDRIPVLTLQIAYIEEAAERELKIIFEDSDHLTLRWSEHPGDVILTGLLEQITVGSGNVNPLVEQLVGRMNPDSLSRTLQSFIEPVVQAVREGEGGEREWTDRG